ATHKTKRNVFMRRELVGRAKQGVQRMTGAVVSGVHHYKLSRQSVSGTKLLAPNRIKLHRIVVRPWRDRHQFLFRDSLVNNSLLHEAIKHHYSFGPAQAVVEQTAQRTRGKGVLFEPTRGYRFIRIQVHHPKNQASALERHEERAEYGNQRRRGQRHYYIETRQQQETKRADNQKRCEV